MICNGCIHVFETWLEGSIPSVPAKIVTAAFGYAVPMLLILTITGYD